jgi:hypothetical protein
VTGWRRLGRVLGCVLGCAAAGLTLLACTGAEPPAITGAAAPSGAGAGYVGGGVEDLDVRIEVRAGAGADEVPEPVRLGADVSVVVIGDATSAAEEVRVDEFGVSAAMPAGGRGVLRFRADRPGFFPVEAVGAGTVLAVVEVMGPGL